MRAKLGVAPMFASAILSGCAGGTDTAEESVPASGQPAAAAPAVTAAPVSEATGVDAPAAAETTAASVSAVAGPAGCAPGTPIEEQKARLIEIATAQFLGENYQGLPRLPSRPG